MTDFVKPDPYRAFSGFGDPLAAPITPRIQIDAVYGVVSTDHETVISGGGTGPGVKLPRSRAGGPGG